MTGKLDKFYIEYGIHGATLNVTSLRLTPGCLADGEIDWYVDALQADLEACRREMKRRAIKEKDAIFQKAFSRA